MKVGFVTVDWSVIPDKNGHPTLGGSGWYRVGLPHRYLERNGYDVVIGSQVAFNRATQTIAIVDHDERTHDDLDIVVMSRWMNEVGPEVVSRAVANGQVVINDVDDWYDGLAPSNIAFRTTHAKFNPSNNRNHYRKILGASTGCIVSTPFLREKTLRVNPNVVVCRNAIDLERWQPTDYELPTIGWVGAVPWRSRDLEECRGVLSDLLSVHSDVRLFHGGHIDHPAVPSLATLVGVDKDRVDTMGMCSILDYPNFFRWFNIGIVPLSDAPFNEAKSFVKGLEYAAAGIPFVASPSPEYRVLHESGIGRLARRYKEWRRELSLLVVEEERERLASVQLDVVRAKYDFADRWVDWKTALETISGYTLSAGSSAPREYAQPVLLQATADTRP